MCAVFAALSFSRAGMDACMSAQEGAQEIQELGHDIPLMPPTYLNTPDPLCFRASTCAWHSHGGSKTSKKKSLLGTRPRRGQPPHRQKTPP